MFVLRTQILQQLWFNANYFARDLVKDVIEPNVALALSGYKLNGFKFDRIILGTIAPRIGGIKVYDMNVTRNEIIMDLDLFYTSDCDISFQVAGMRGGLKHFQIQGMLRVVMKPLINKIPLVGGLQIFFLNNPHVDFNLVGVTDVLDIPGVSDLLRKVIVEQIGAIMVLPNKLPITLNADVLASTLKMPEPEVRGRDIELNDKKSVLLLRAFSRRTGCDANSRDRGQGPDEEGHQLAGQGQIRSVCDCVGGCAVVPFGDDQQYCEPEMGLLV